MEHKSLDGVSASQLFSLVITMTRRGCSLSPDSAWWPLPSSSSPSPWRPPQYPLASCFSGHPENVLLFYRSDNIDTQRVIRDDSLNKWCHISNEWRLTCLIQFTAPWHYWSLSSTNERPLSKSLDLSWPNRGQYPSHVIILDQSEDRIQYHRPLPLWAGYFLPRHWRLHWARLCAAPGHQTFSLCSSEIRQT